MRVHFLPKTSLGKWSIRGIVGTIVFILLIVLLDEVFHVIGAKSPVNITLTLLAGISGISAFFTGIIGIIKSKDRSVIVFIATIIGFLVLFLFVVGGDWGN